MTFDQKGQSVVEIVIMTAVMVTISTLVIAAFRNNEYFANLVSSPWRVTAGLIQNGVWGAQAETMSKHPNNFTRVNSVQGDLVE